MPNVDWVERQIRRVEGFDVRFLWPAGADVRGDKQNIPSYEFERAASGDATVETWKATRFRRQYPGFEVKVVTANGQTAQGNTRLHTVRDTYRS